MSCRNMLATIMKITTNTYISGEIVERNTEAVIMRIFRYMIMISQK